MTENQATEMISLLTEIRDILGRSQPQRKAVRASDSNETTLADHVGETRQYMEAIMPFGKHKGSTFGDVPVSYFRYLSTNWEPKGFDSDAAFASAFADIGAKAAKVDNTEVAQPDDADDGEEIPF